VDLQKLIYPGSTWVIPILIAITFHEAAHAYAAWRLGDDTALREGRVTFNPRSERSSFQPFSSSRGLLSCSGGRSRYRSNFIDSQGLAGTWRSSLSAGPLTNVILAFASAILLHVVSFTPASAAPWLTQTLYQSILLNLILGIFNMLPIPPLDGSRILVGIMPGALARPYAKLERFGFMILLGLVFLVPMAARQLGLELNLFRWLVGLPVAYLTRMVLWLTGQAS
jgi:Zn-dependent protease